MSFDPTFASSQQLIQLSALATRWAKLPKSRARATAMGAGQSRFRGRGLDFAEVRAYTPGDDVRTIDWKITARKGRTHTRLYTEERERPVIIVCDLSSSLFFGSRTQFKSVLVAQAAAFCAWMAKEQGDRVGAVVFDEWQHLENKPVLRQQGVLTLLQWLERVQLDQLRRLKEDDYPQPVISFAEQFTQLARMVRPGSRVLIFSDFVQHDPSAELALGQIASHSSLHVFRVFDRLETELPDPGLYPVIIDHQPTLLDSRDRQVRRQFRQLGQKRFKQLEHQLEQLNSPLLSLSNQRLIDQYLPLLAEAMQR